MTKPKNLSPAVDAYLDKIRPFAIPILLHLRDLIHKGCPGVQETIKWSRPFFEYRGVILCNISAFKEHCSFSFWGQEIGAVLREADLLEADGMGSLGRITSLASLPPDKQMLGWIRQAAGFIDREEYTSPISAHHRVVKAPKPIPGMPSEFSLALEKNRQAASVFANFNPSCKREYLEWIAEAKRPETQAKRIATAIEWIAEGKQRNWKYQVC